MGVIHAVTVVVICMRGRNTEVPLCNELVMKLVARVLVAIGGMVDKE